MTRRVLTGIPITAVVTLAIGIGAATAVVTVAEALLFRPLPVAAEERLAILHGATPDGQFPNVPLTLDELSEFQRQSRALEQVAYHTFRGAATETFRSADRALQLRTSLVSGNWFATLGARPALGRAFRVEEDTRGGAPVLVLSHRAWQEQFGGDSAVIGRRITLATSGSPLQIIGVMPAGLEYPRGTEAWTPLTAYSIANGSFELTSNVLDILGRLASGVTREQAREELTAFFSRLPVPGWRNEVRGVVQGFREIVLGDVRPAMRIVLLAAVMLLVIACVNVSNLLLVRSIDRARELVVRAALGASRWRLVRHQLTETARLATAAGIAGTMVAMVAVKLFIAFAPPGLPRLDTVAVNGSALASAIAVTVLSLIVAGLTPAVLASRVNAGDALRSGTKTSMSKPVRLAGEVLVTVQVALAVVALSAAALVTRSFINLQRTDLAFDAKLLVAADLVIPSDRLADNARYQDLHQRLSERLTNMPGVRNVTPVLSVPFIGGGGGIDGRVALPGQGPEDRQQNPIVNMEIVTPNYFTTIGTPVLQGRAFTGADREGAPGVVIVSASTARALWPGQDPLGRRVEMGRNRELTVVGVVPDTRYRDLRSARPSVYFPLAQSFFPVAPAKLLVRTEGVVSAAALIRQAVTEVDPGVTVASVATLEQHLEGPRAQPRLNSLILGAFAVAALALAAVGLFSVMSTMVRRRTREIGIRMALGATSQGVRTMVVLRSVLIAACGTAAGLVAARATGALLSGLLYGIESSDILTTAAVAFVVLSVAIIASVLPARRGSRVDPVVALRTDF
jgi:putative ABC transport system permease protein